MTQQYKLFTHDLRPPVQGGDPVWDGSYPFELPTVTLDTSNRECGAGWNYEFTHRPVFEVDAQRRAWLLIVAERHIWQEARRRRRTVPIDAHVDHLAAPPVTADDLLTVRGVVDELPTRQRAAATARMLGLSYDQACAATGISFNKALLKARRRVAEAMAA